MTEEKAPPSGVSEGRPEPRTEAGKRLLATVTRMSEAIALEWNGVGVGEGTDDLRDAIAAVEAETARLGPPREDEFAPREDRFDDLLMQARALDEDARAHGYSNGWHDHADGKEYRRG